MGIIESVKGGILSGLNNMTVFSIFEDIFSEYFGFTLDEIKPYVPEDQWDDLMSWYNGYTFGEDNPKELINPWSFSSWYFFGRKFKPYWTSTSSTNTFVRQFPPQSREVFIDSCEMLYTNNSSVSLDNVSCEVEYRSKYWSLEQILNFLVITGYLTFKDGKVSIPNKEVRLAWHDEIMAFFEDIAGPLKVEELMKAIRDRKIPDIEKSMRDLLEVYLSFHDFKNENSYHCSFLASFVLCMKVSNPDFHVSSNKESGLGRFDILIDYRKIKEAIIFELKFSKSVSNLEQDAKLALEQIKNKKYGIDLKGYSLHKIGVAFSGKEMSFRYEEPEN